MESRETFGERVTKNRAPDFDPIDFQIPYWLYHAAQFSRGKKPIEEYILDCIESQIKFDNSMKTLDAQLSNKYLENYREKRDEQKAE